MSTPAATKQYAELPFVADVPDPKRPGKTTRIDWNIPDEADYGAAFEMGEHWAVAWLAHDQQLQAGLSRLPDRMLEREATLPPGSRSHGFRVGFLHAITSLAHYGAKAWGGADVYVAAAQNQRKEQAEKVAAEERAHRSAARSINRIKRKAANG